MPSKTLALCSFSACQTWISVAAQAVEAIPKAATPIAVVKEERQREIWRYFFICSILNKESPAQAAAGPLHQPIISPSPHSCSNQDYYALCGYKDFLYS